MAGTEHTLEHNSSGNTTVQRKHRHEGPKNHLLAFALSIMLTALAFLAVAYSIAEDSHVDGWFVQFFIIGLAVFQAVIQLGYWMHMKDKGHSIPIFGIIFGFFVAITCALAGLLWSFW